MSPSISLHTDLLYSLFKHLDLDIENELAIKKFGFEEFLDMVMTGRNCQNLILHLLKIIGSLEGDESLSEDCKFNIL
jgi:hypothetical protein